MEKQQTVNQRIIFLKELLGIQKNVFAQKIDSNVSTLWRIENEPIKPSKKIIVKISQVFNVSTDWLMEGKGEIFKSGTNIENIENAQKMELQKNDVSVDFLKQELEKKNSLISQFQEQILQLTQAVVNLSGGKANFLKDLSIPGALNKLFKKGAQLGSMQA